MLRIATGEAPIRAALGPGLVMALNEALDSVEQALSAAGCARGSTGMWQCPAHADADPSLSVKIGHSGVVLNCFAGCETRDVLAALGLSFRSLFPSPDAPPREPGRCGGAGEPKGFQFSDSEIETVYPYAEDLQVVRLVPEARGRPPGAPKTISRHLCADGTWRSGLGDRKGSVVPLYREDAAVRGLQGGDTLYIAEGEKDADAVHAAGQVSCTNMNGANAFRTEHAQVLARAWKEGADLGARIVLLEDRDAAGRKRVITIRRRLEEAGVAPEAIVTRRSKVGNDVSDHLAAGHSIESLEPSDVDETRDEGDGEETPFEPFAPIGDDPGPPFPTEALPTWLGEWVCAEAEHSQTAPDLAGTLALGVLSTARAGRTRIESPPGHVEPVNLFLATVLPSGSRKSSVFAAAKRPIQEFERELVEGTRSDRAIERERLRLLEDRVDHARKQAAKGEGDERYEAENDLERIVQERAEMEAGLRSEPRIVTDDCTPEMLALILSQQAGRIAIWCPEGGELFEMMRGRYATNSRANLGVYLQGHAGDSVAVDRKHGESIRIDEPALTIATTIQPQVLEDLGLERAARGRGLHARFLFSLPATTLGSRAARTSPVPASIEDTYHARVRFLLSDEEPRLLRLSPEAEALSIDFFEGLEPRLDPHGGDLSDLADWAGKLPGAVSRLAGLLHEAAHVGGETPELVPGGTMQAAIQLGEYFLEHARRAFLRMAMPEVGGAGKIWRSLVRLAEREVGKLEVGKKELYDRVKGGIFRKAADLRPALGLLEERGYIARVPPPEGKQGTTERYRVNPIALRATRTGRGPGGGTRSTRSISFAPD